VGGSVGVCQVHTRRDHRPRTRLHASLIAVCGEKFRAENLDAQTPKSNVKYNIAAPSEAVENLRSQVTQLVIRALVDRYAGRSGGSVITVRPESTVLVGSSLAAPFDWESMNGGFRPNRWRLVAADDFGRSCPNSGRSLRLADLYQEAEDMGCRYTGKIDTYLRPLNRISVNPRP
jgi:hypothetical protein